MATTYDKIIRPLGFIIFFSVLNGTMFQVGIPDIAAEYGLLPSEVSWVMTGYILVFAIGSLIYGKLADIFPVKGLITTGLLIMNAGALTGLFSMWYPMLIIGRLMQALGGAAIPALAMIVATRYFPADARGRALGIIASTVALAAGVGPILGGFITGTLHWRYMFLPNLSTMLALPLLLSTLPDESKLKYQFDIMGALLVAGGASLLLISVTEGIFWPMPSGMVLLVLFALRVRRVKDPLVNPSLFSIRPYVSTIITTFLCIGTVFGMMFMVPIMLRDLNGLDANMIGLTVFPGALSAVVMGYIGGRLSDRLGSRFVFYCGSILLAGGFLILSTFTGSPPWVIAVKLLVCYAGFAFLQSALPHTVSKVLPREQMGTGMGLYNLFFFISGAFSTAAIGRILDITSVRICLNPLSLQAGACIYSNAFIMLATAVVVAVLIFFASSSHLVPGRDE